MKTEPIEETRWDIKGRAWRPSDPPVPIRFTGKRTEKIVTLDKKTHYAWIEGGGYDNNTICIGLDTRIQLDRWDALGKTPEEAVSKHVDQLAEALESAREKVKELDSLLKSAIQARARLEMEAAMNESKESAT